MLPLIRTINFKGTPFAEPTWTYWFVAALLNPPSFRVMLFFHVLANFPKLAAQVLHMGAVDMMMPLHMRDSADGTL